MADLKRCPFCGSTATTEVRVTQMGGGMDIIDFSVVCSECGTHKTSRIKIVKCATFLDVEKAMIQAENVWNRRATDEAD